jgi:hypothetical protein
MDGLITVLDENNIPMPEELLTIDPASLKRKRKKR